MNRYLIGHFEYSKRRDVILPMGDGAVYNLMRDIHKVIFRIHDFCPIGPRQCIQAPPHLTYSSYATASGEGRQLSLAIQEATIKRYSQEFEEEIEQLSTMSIEQQSGNDDGGHAGATNSFFSRR